MLGTGAVIYNTELGDEVNKTMVSFLAFLNTMEPKPTSYILIFRKRPTLLTNPNSSNSDYNSNQQQLRC